MWSLIMTEMDTKESEKHGHSKDNKVTSPQSYFYLWSDIKYILFYDFYHHQDSYNNHQ